MTSVPKNRSLTRSSTAASPPIRSAVAYVQMSAGGFSGGSLTTGISNAETPVQLTAGVDPEDPFLLGGRPRGGARAEDADDAIITVVDMDDGVSAGPSVMHNVNSRVVRRSAACLGYVFMHAYRTPPSPYIANYTHPHI